jgi:RNA polymerase sigma-70 factor (ECF subfamily)
MTASDQTWPDEPGWVARLRSGDETAFEKLVRAEAPRLLRVARRFLPLEEDARDAVQDTFVSAFRSIERFEEGSRLSTWLHRIMINACLMKLRARRRRPEGNIESLLPAYRPDGHQTRPSEPWTASVEEMVQRTETAKLVRDRIEQLPDTYRIVLIMRDLEEMSTEETARILGITPNAVKVRLHRARQALRTLLDPHMRELTR